MYPEAVALDVEVAVGPRAPKEQQNSWRFAYEIRAWQVLGTYPGASIEPLTSA